MAFAVILEVSSIQNNNRVIETEKAEVSIKGKGMIECVGIDEGKTCAVEKAETRCIKFPEDTLHSGASPYRYAS